MRKIIHVDMDCFYAAVEARENPALKGKPVAVGGASDGRGVVAACSYEAREFGVHSAMPTSKALRLCPNLIRVPVNMPLYREISANIRKIFQLYTDLIEPLSLDEAYLDVTGSKHCHGSATLIAQEIRQKIFESERITASAGIAPNKFLAKIASDWQKPNGQFVITPEQVSDFVLALPVKKIHGVGKVTAKKMHDNGLYTCTDLQKHSKHELNLLFGSFGERLYDLARGEDNRAVNNERKHRSTSTENTYREDLPNLQSCKEKIPSLFDDLQKRLGKSPKTKQLKIKSCFVKVKFNDFSSTTAQMPCFALTDDMMFYNLLETAWKRGKRPVRLLGLGVHFQQPEEENFQLQLSL